MDKDLEEYTDKISNLLVTEFMEDVDLRYDYVSELKQQRTDHIAALSQDEKNKLYNDYDIKSSAAEGLPIEMASNLNNFELLFTLHDSKGNREKAQEMFDSFTKARNIFLEYRDTKEYNPESQEQLSTQIQQEFEKFDPKEVQQLKEKVYTNKIFYFENKDNMKNVLDAQLNRSHEYTSEESFGYCLRALTASMYKQQAKYKVIDFLPSNAEEAMRNKSFINYCTKQFPDSVFATDENTTLSDLIDKHNIKPGAIISLSPNGVPSHAMLYTHKEEDGTHRIMGFNNETKNSNASFRKDGTKHEAFIVNTPELIKNSLIEKIKNFPKSKAMEFLQNIEKEINQPLPEKNFKDAIAEGKRYTPEQQWNKYYKRSDVKFDVEKNIEIVKNRLKEKRRLSENKQPDNTISRTNSPSTNNPIINQMSNKAQEK